MSGIPVGKTMHRILTVVASSPHISMIVDKAVSLKPGAELFSVVIGPKEKVIAFCRWVRAIPYNVLIDWDRAGNPLAPKTWRIELMLKTPSELAVPSSNHLRYVTFLTISSTC